jgi:hypothetical protein
VVLTGYSDFLHHAIHRISFFSSDKAYQLFAQRWWFSPGIPASSTTKTDRHDIAEILLKVLLNTKNSYFFLHILLNQAHGEVTQ